MTRIPLTCPDIGAAEVREVEAVIRSGKLEQGCEVEALERRFAEFTGARYAVAVNTGTAALHLALLAHGVGKGGVVYTSALGEPAILDAIHATGALPVMVDVDPYTYTISLSALERAVSSFTRNSLTCHSSTPELRGGVLLANHVFGQPCDMSGLRQLADSHGLALVEIAWDALGALYRGQPLGGTGTAVFSFQHGRAIDAGEGGMLTTDSESVAFMARKLRNYGCDCCGKMDEYGFNYRMTDVTAALVLGQLDAMDKHLEVRTSVAMSYGQALYDVEGLEPPSVLPGTRHAFQRYGVRLTAAFPLRPAGAVRYMARQGVTVSTGRNLIVPTMARATCLNGRDSFPEAERLARQLLFLPIFASLGTEGIARVVHALRAVAWPDTDLEEVKE